MFCKKFSVNRKTGVLNEGNRERYSMLSQQKKQLTSKQQYIIHFISNNAINFRQNMMNKEKYQGELMMKILILQEDIKILSTYKSKKKVIKQIKWKELKGKNRQILIQN